MRTTTLVDNIKKIEGKGILVVTHANCMDGNGSVLALAETFGIAPSKIEVIFMTYGTPLEELFKRGVHRDIVMCDFSLKRDEMLELDRISKSLLVIDHHKTAEDNLKGLDFCIFDMSESGASLTWKTFNEDKELPIVLDYIKDRDLWTWKLPDSKVVSTGLFEKVGLSDLEKLDTLNIYSIAEFITPERLAVQDYIDFRIQSISGKPLMFTFTHDGITIPMLNNAELNSEVGNVLALKYPAVLLWFITPEGLKLSFRSSDENPISFDVSEIARSIGGGGHARAAGANFGFDSPFFKKFFEDMAS